MYLSKALSIFATDQRITFPATADNSSAGHMLSTVTLGELEVAWLANSKPNGSPEIPLVSLGAELEPNEVKLGAKVVFKTFTVTGGVGSGGGGSTNEDGIMMLFGVAIIDPCFSSIWEVTHLEVSVTVSVTVAVAITVAVLVSSGWGRGVNGCQLMSATGLLEMGDTVEMTDGSRFERLDGGWEASFCRGKFGNASIIVRVPIPVKLPNRTSTSSVWLRASELITKYAMMNGSNGESRSMLRFCGDRMKNRTLLEPFYPRKHGAPFGRGHKWTPGGSIAQFRTDDQERKQSSR